MLEKVIKRLSHGLITEVNPPTLPPSHTFLRFSSCPLETATVGCSRKENHIMYHCVQKHHRILCIIQNVVHIATVVQSLMESLIPPKI